MDSSKYFLYFLWNRPCICYIRWRKWSWRGDRKRILQNWKQTSWDDIICGYYTSPICKKGNIKNWVLKDVFLGADSFCMDFQKSDIYTHKCRECEYLPGKYVCGTGSNGTLPNILLHRSLVVAPRWSFDAKKSDQNDSNEKSRACVIPKNHTVFW